jgi:hypothetical protein
MLGLAGIPAALQFLGFLCLPESPRWLVMCGKDDVALSVLADISGEVPWLSAVTATPAAVRVELVHPLLGCALLFAQAANHDGSPVTSVAVEQLQEMKRSVHEGGQQLSTWAVLRSRDLRSQLLLGVTLQLIQQLAGINTVMYYRSAGALCYLYPPLRFHHLPNH